MANDNYIAVVPAAVGGGNILMQTYQNPVNGNTVQIEAIALVDTTGANSVGVTNGALNVYLGTINPVTVIQSNASNLSATVSGTINAVQSGTWNIGTITNISGNVGTKETPDSTSTYCPSTATSAAYESNHVIKASAGVLYGVTGHNGRASQQYILLFNTTSLPADGTAPNFPPLNVPAGQTFSLDFPKFGRYFSTGIVICNSTTNATKTLGGNDCWFDAMYA